ncbi:AGE family epimerase/isomerase [Maricaulis salignorans]|uniref:Mannose-6-phosphate isomerase, type 3 n=1 Tax=Maricaulis salignorans TaxID=144026 RepID=A0A1G9WYG5_9PROT|nr:AGE family epimerase/isomerase [Maricaulis salignorans]SDM89468.1 mannose-6-phosphate isomerase, type 3 [Maricaulis salignorans]
MDGVGRIAQWGVQTALPFWAAHGWDDVHGGFAESIALDGSVIIGEARRVRVQARQIYVFARAHHEGWFDGLGRATEAASLLRQRAWQVDGQPGWVHLLTETGAVADPVRDLYDHAFILLALAWLGRASGDVQWFDLAGETLDFLDAEMADPAGGYRESVSGPQWPRRQNPHMHLFEALLALYEASGDPQVLARAKSIKTLFDTVFHDAGVSVVREFFDADWARATGDLGAVVEPGHLCEWSWLLHEFHRLSGEALDPAAIALFETAMRLGVNGRTGLLCAAVNARGEVLDGSSRTWMQTEWLRTAALMRRLGHPGADAYLQRAGDGILNYHLKNAVAGGWIDRFDAVGQARSDRIPASTLYHAFGGIAECLRPAADSPQAAGTAV